MNKLFTLACILFPFIGSGKTTGITIPTLYPHFGSSQPDANAMGPTPVRLISKTMTKYDGKGYVPFDSVSYSYSNGRGGILDLDYTDNFLNFDHSVSYDFDVVSGTYKNSLRYTQTFFPNNNVQYRVQEQWINDQVQWHNNIRHEYIYDNSLSRLEQMQMASWNGSWQGNTFNYKLLYNAKNDIIEIQYINNNVTTLEYDAAHNVSGRMEYTYVPGQGWTYTDKYFFSYDASGNLISYVYQQYVNGDWVNSLKKDFVYAGNNVSSTVEYSWRNSTWQVVRQNIFSYDGANNKLSDSYQTWNEGSGSFDNTRREEWTYNAQNQPLTYKSLTWSAANQNWQPVNNDFLYRYEYEYYYPTSVNSIAKASDLFTLYPQPASNVLNINFKSMANANYQGYIYDFKGSMVKSFEVSANENSIPLGDIPAGNYMISLNHKGQKIAQPLVVMR